MYVSDKLNNKKVENVQICSRYKGQNNLNKEARDENQVWVWVTLQPSCCSCAVSVEIFLFVCSFVFVMSFLVFVRFLVFVYCFVFVFTKFNLKVESLCYGAVLLQRVLVTNAGNLITRDHQTSSFLSHNVVLCRKIFISFAKKISRQLRPSLAKVQKLHR